MIDDVAAIIVHYRNYPDVLDTIEDVVREGVAESSIYLIDNGGFPEGKAAMRHPALKLIKGHGNVGYAAAVNIGVSAAKFNGAAFALVLTHEVRLGRGLVEALHAEICNTQVGAAAPVIRRKSDPTSIWSAGGDLSRTMVPTSRQRWTADSVDWVDGCCFMTRIAQYDALGGMYEPFFLYMEEVDYFTRLRAVGKRIVVLQGVEALQEPGGMTLYYATRNRILLARRHATRRTVAIIALSHFIKYLVETTVLRRSRREKATMRLRGLTEGLRVPAGRQTMRTAREFISAGSPS